MGKMEDFIDKKSSEWMWNTFMGKKKVSFKEECQVIKTKRIMKTISLAKQ